MGATDRPPRSPDEPAGKVVVRLQDFRGFALRPDGPASPVGFVSAFGPGQRTARRAADSRRRLTRSCISRTLAITFDTNLFP
jgi:hypothetical protein